MFREFSRRSRYLFAAAAAVGFVIAAAAPSLAAPATGCDPKVLDAMQKKAQARVAYDIAVTEEIVDKPDSVLAMTCFNQAAGVSADKGGSIFSGDFTAELTPIVGDALTEMYTLFDDSVGDDSGVVDYTATALTNVYNCNEMDDLWTEVETEGVQAGVPYVTFDELVSGAAPGGAGTDFTANWGSSGGVFGDLNAAVTALPTPSVPSFVGDETSCDVLVTAGIIAGPCP